MPIETVDEAVLKDRAVRLFEFLVRIQKVRSKSYRTLESYESQGGKVIHFGSLPTSPAIRGSFFEPASEPDAPFLVLDRIARKSVPDPPERLKTWLESGWDKDPSAVPVLLEETAVWSVENDYSPSALYLAEQPEVRELFEGWLPEWRSWAANELEAQKVRSVYTSVFQMSGRVTDAPEELELLLGVGTLAWRPQNHDEVKRPVLVLPVSITFDDATGTLTVEESESSKGPMLELDMMDPGLWPEANRTNQLREDVQDFEGNLLSEESIAPILKRIAHNLGSAGHYSEQVFPASPGDEPNIVFSPVLLLRKRSNESLIRVFNEIRSQLEASPGPPQGIAGLVSVLRAPLLEGPGSVILDSDQQIYLPLAANKEQLRIVDRVNSKPYVVVQGPPGTGKTHTIANLVSHLLAQGKKVLVTAQTDRALRELRAKLPDPLEQLCVSAVGRDQSDLTDLRVAVNALAARAEDFDPIRERERIAQLRGVLDGFRRHRAEIQSRLIKRRETEVTEYEIGQYAGTLAQIAQMHRSDAERFSWLEEFEPILPAEIAPLNNSKARELATLLADDLVRSSMLGGAQLLDLSTIEDPDYFSELCTAASSANNDLQRYGNARSDPAYGSISRLTQFERSALRTRAIRLAEEVRTLASREEPWMAQAMRDINQGKPGVWRRRAEEIQRLLADALPLIQWLGVTPRIEIPGGTSNLAALAQQAEGLSEHLSGGGKLRTLIGIPAPVRQAQSLVDNVRVDGRRPDSIDVLDRFIVWYNAERILQDIEQLWPADVPIPQEDTLSERWAWNDGEVVLLTKVIALAERLSAEEEFLAVKDIPRPDWSNLESVQQFAITVEAAESAEKMRQSEAPLVSLATRLAFALRWSDSDSVMDDLTAAAIGRDPRAYRDAYMKIQALHRTQRAVLRRDELLEPLEIGAPNLKSALLSQFDSDWSTRLGGIEEAWSWRAVGARIDEEAANDSESLQLQSELLEQKTLTTLGELTAALAWERSVARLGPGERQSLKGYALAVKKLGKGTGKYAQHKRGIAQDALKECREAVPAWVMPIYRIAETLPIARDIFDVVIIDEASQAGLEAAFLQYLAPKVVVVGDDKQVSPAGVGIDQQQLIDLRKQYLYDFPQGHLWENPQTSFFDLANIKYGDVITLREHFRCVPEIIGFSNQIAYEPDNVPLIPLRQYGTDRLDPVRLVYVADGYAQGGSSNRINDPEADAIVDAIAKCLADPAYEGKTIGVISLTGRAQAARIEKKLFAEVDLLEIRSRELRCGDAPDFQGSERDVIFLSLVATRDAGFTALTSELYLQRFNVAASRAKDQMWLFHSVLPSDIPNRNDLRLRLLEYCLAAAASKDIGTEANLGSMPEHQRVDPFDSLFEQHVFNDLTRRRYNVVPQWEVYGYHIDLVVVGGQRRLAIECDGDHWHGAEAYEMDLNRQRELERCGWKFFRLPASTYYRDPNKALEPLWDLLDQRDIRPTGWTRPASASAEGAASEEDLQIFSTTSSNSTDESFSPPQITYENPTEIEEDWEIESLEEPADGPPSAPQGEDIAPSAELGPFKPTVVVLAGPSQGLAEYIQWNTRNALPGPIMASTTERIRGLMQIVEVEGPVLASRVFSLYVRSAGMSKVGKQIKTSLNVALSAALRKGELIGDNPLDEEGNIPLTLRTPNQEPVRVRLIGPRNFHEVPPSELGALIRKVSSEFPYDGQEELCRRILAGYGLKKITEKTWERFLQCWDLAKQ